jgi:urease accessory protein
MRRDSKFMRGDGPTIFTSIKNDESVDDVVELILGAWRTAGEPGTQGAVGDDE